jgi:O-antigen/teichoic acid export membrane protein
MQLIQMVNLNGNQVQAERAVREEERSLNTNRSLGASARASLKWAGGFILLRDVVRFTTMLVLVRLLQPSDYGSFALALSIVSLFSVFSFSTFLSHTLQFRDLAGIDWQAHFTAGVVVNVALALLTLIVAWVLTFTNSYAPAAIPLAVLSLVFLVDLPAALRQRMLQVRHDWRRFRLLAFFGSVLSSFAAVVIACLGGGIWALIVQPVTAGFPATIDLLMIAKWRPQLTWSWARYRSTAAFGATRMIAGLLPNGRQTLEQSLLAGTYHFAALGVFTRAMGVATLIAGRLAGAAVESLYPIITRAERGSVQFERYASLMMRGVVWITVPVSVLLALFASDVVALLYGPKWGDVVPLLPLAAIAVGFGAVAMAAQSLLLAHNEVRACLAIDIISAASGVTLAFWLVPVGIQIYVSALVAHGMLLLGLAVALLVRAKGIGRASLLVAFLPPATGVMAAVSAVFGARVMVGSSSILPIRLVCESALFGMVYLAVLRLAFKRALQELVEVAPAGDYIAAILALKPRKF